MKLDLCQKYLHAAHEIAASHRSLSETISCVSDSNLIIFSQWLAGVYNLITFNNHLSKFYQIEIIYVVDSLTLVTSHAPLLDNVASVNLHTFSLNNQSQVLLVLFWTHNTFAGNNSITVTSILEILTRCFNLREWKKLMLMSTRVD